MLKLLHRSVNVEPEAGGCDENGVSRRVQFKAKCPETSGHYARLESVMAITLFQTGVSWHFRSFKDLVLKIEL